MGNSQKNINRRTFLTTAAKAATGALAVPALGSRAFHDPENRTSPESSNAICIFSKHLQWLDYEDLGKFVRDVGFDGVDLTVREGGHVPPEKAERLLPEAADKIRKAGVSVPMMATDINDADDPLTGPILRTAGNHGIKFYRMEYYRYDQRPDIEKYLEELRPVVAKLAKMNKQYDIHGAYQNHSGSRVGASIWDIWYLIKDLDPRWIGMQFDIRHATVEGARSWVNDFSLVKDFVKCSVAKDFHWIKTKDGQWNIKNMPLGEGMADLERYFAMYKKFGLDGPISLHIEYPIFERDEHTLSKSEKMKFARKVLAKDLETLRTLLQKADIIE